MQWIILENVTAKPKKSGFDMEGLVSVSWNQYTLVLKIVVNICDLFDSS